MACKVSVRGTVKVTTSLNTVALQYVPTVSGWVFPYTICVIKVCL